MFSLRFKHFKKYLLDKQKLHVTFDRDDDIVTRHDPNGTAFDDYYVVFVSCVNKYTMDVHLSETDPEK